MIIWRNIWSSVNSRSFKSVGYLLKRNAQPEDINTALLNTTLKNKIACFFSNILSKTSTFMICLFLISILASQMISFIKDDMSLHGVAGRRVGVSD